MGVFNILSRCGQAWLVNPWAAGLLHVVAAINLFRVGPGCGYQSTFIGTIAGHYLVGWATAQQMVPGHGRPWWQLCLLVVECH